MKNRLLPFGALLFSISLLHAQENIEDISLSDMLDLETELTADVGSRSGAVSSLDSLSPTDVITDKEIQYTGLTSLTDVLRYFVAGFNAPETSVADGSDHVRAFTLRGMSPDQILVLINGKRVHTSALLHVNGTIGRGSSHVDLDTIALDSIEKIEILRDGAAAQYGSDAISGVINIILKGAGHNNKFTLHGGERQKGDGEQLSSSLFLTQDLPYDGFMNATLQVKKQNKTQRAGEDRRKNASIYKTHVGIPDATNILALLNSDIELQNATTLYSVLTFNYRESEASTFSREKTPNYPNGFLPMLQATITDTGMTLGAKGLLENGYNWDISNTLGYNQIKYTMYDTYNYDLNPSPNTFYNGTLSFLQNTTNIDLEKKYGNTNVAFGLEHRYEHYIIKPGDPSSYYESGSQGFSGYREENSVDASRNSEALYLDIKNQTTAKLLIQAALRYEHYSDFKATTTAKLAVGYSLTKQLLFRSSVSTGFRAPSLSQSHYSHTSTFNGLIEGTFKPSDAVAQLFGAKPLKAEKSKHFTLGTVYQYNNEHSLSIDYFYTYIADRIILSNEYTLTPQQQNIYGVNKARFFSNAVNTKTYGIDIKYNYEHQLQKSNKVTFSLWYNYSKNKVVGFNDSTTTRENSFEQIDRMENGQPKTNIKSVLRYYYKHYTTTFNTSYIGSYREVVNDVAYNFKAQVYNDIDIAYDFKKNMQIALGALNMFNTVPNKWDGLDGYTYGYNGIKPYSRYSPYGYSGAYYYIRYNYSF